MRLFAIRRHRWNGPYLVDPVTFFLVRRNVRDSVSARTDRASDWDVGVGQPLGAIAADGVDCPAGQSGGKPDRGAWGDPIRMPDRLVRAKWPAGRASSPPQLVGGQRAGRRSKATHHATGVRGRTNFVVPSLQ